MRRTTNDAGRRGRAGSAAIPAPRLGGGSAVDTGGDLAAASDLSVVSERCQATQPGRAGDRVHDGERGEVDEDDRRTGRDVEVVAEVHAGETRGGADAGGEHEHRGERVGEHPRDDGWD